ncbi:MAG: PKD domain-containing protein, partial [Flavobacteriales bacterium]
TVITVTVSPAPVAQISVASSTGCAPYTAVFSNTTSGSPTYVWNFGDGGTSASAAPNHLYSNPGTYPVQLIAIQGSCSDTARLQVNVVPSPIAAFTSPTSVCAGDTVRFNNTGSSGTFNWNFGDGSPTVSQSSPAHVYAAAGTFTATLVVVDGSGCTDTAATTLSIAALPTVNFTGSALTGCDTLTVNFSSAVTGATNYVWSFGDGTTSTLQGPSHTYTAPGTYSVVLTASNTAGCSTTRAKNNYVVLRASPTPQFS